MTSGASDPGAVHPADDLLHEPDLLVDGWTENWWSGVFVPEQHLSCFVLLQTHFNLGVTGLGVWVWDDIASTTRGFPYARTDWVLPPLKGDLDDVVVDDRFHLLQVKPLDEYHLRYSDGDRLAFDLRLKGVLAPQKATSHTATGRIHQPMWATGVISLPDRDVPVDGPGTRSRRWGPSASQSAKTSSYSYGVSKELSFSAMWRQPEGGETSLYDGYIHRNQRTTAIVDGARHVLDRIGDYPVDIALELLDADGHTTTIYGQTANTAELEPWAGQDGLLSLTSWNVDDTHIWGADAEISGR